MDLMAFLLEREKTTSTPYLLIDEEKNYMKLQGRSFNEKAIEFFKDINNWLDSYLITDFGTFTFECEMDYFNSSTVKALHDIILKMDKYASDEKKVIINWITVHENDIVIECGEDFLEEIVNAEFNMVLS
jgi:hypothetical protein